MGDNCPVSCKHGGFHYCGMSGTHCDKHCVCMCHLCADERKEAKPVQLPEEVREKIRTLWKTDIQHAAKQAFCFFLDYSDGFNTDHDLVVNIGLETGMLAQCMSKGGADFFISAFETSILNS